MKKAWKLTAKVKMVWLDRIVHSIKSTCRGVASRLRIHRSGPTKLWQDVRRCDYDDVRVMWDILKKKKNRAELGRRPPPPPLSPSVRTRSSSSLLNVFEWARGSCPRLKFYDLKCFLRGRSLSLETEERRKT